MSEGGAGEWLSDLEIEKVALELKGSRESGKQTHTYTHTPLLYAFPGQASDRFLCYPKLCSGR